MDIENFIQELASLRKQYEDLGVSIPKSLDEMFSLKKKYNIDNSYQRFFDGCVVKIFAINQFSFYDSSKDIGECYEIGFIDVDLIVINKKTNEVELFDGYDFSNRYYLAESFNQFLDILLNLAKYHIKFYLMNIDSKELKENKNNLMLTLKKMLKEKYHNYYLDTYN